MSLVLADDDVAVLAGDAGPAAATAMRVVTALAAAVQAPRLIPVESAHIDSCLYHGVAGLDFAERLVDQGGEVGVPTTLNVGSIDLLHPGIVRGNEETMVNGRRLMEAYTALGARATWTCAPYQLPGRPEFGQDIAWAESNAIVFANSVLGARTDRYGDFLDIAAAIVGKVPYSGFHLTERRRGQVVFDVSGLPAELLADELLFPSLGILIGLESGSRVPVIDGVEAADEDQLKALGAAAASSGGIAMFHVVGVTPEARTLREALQGGEAEETTRVTVAGMRRARDLLSSTPATGRIDAVSLGTPHFSLTEITRFAGLIEGRRVADTVDLYVSTSRSILARATELGLVDVCTAAGARFVTDTCTYVTPVLRPEVHTVMTNSAKWAYYAPGNLGIDVVFGSLDECVESACRGVVVRDDAHWNDR